MPCVACLCSNSRARNTVTARPLPEIYYSREAEKRDRRLKLQGTASVLLI